MNCGPHVSFNKSMESHLEMAARTLPWTLPRNSNFGGGECRDSWSTELPIATTTILPPADLLNLHGGWHLDGAPYGWSPRSL
jgi:hypothetical protein